MMDGIDRAAGQLARHLRPAERGCGQSDAATAQGTVDFGRASFGNSIPLDAFHCCECLIVSNDHGEAPPNSGLVSRTDAEEKALAKIARGFYVERHD